MKNFQENNDHSGWQAFVELCLTTTNEQLLEEIFDLFLTPEERDSLKSRCLIVKALLQQDKPQRQIAEDLNVSIAKITRGSNELKRVTPALKAYLKDSL